MKVSELFEEEERSVLSVMGQLRPERGTGGFSCSSNRLTSLEGCPSSVGSSFTCSDNELTSLKGGPSSVGGSFSCSANYLTSLEGAPSSVGQYFYGRDNRLTSLHNIHKQIKHIGGGVNFEDNLIESHVLGLLLIDGLTICHLDNKLVEDIINKHLKGDRDVFACQEELIEAGLEEFAQL